MKTNQHQEKEPWSPWDDPRVKARLKEGKSAYEIVLLMCSVCGEVSYYNQGSHFTCGNCGKYFVALAEGEHAEPGALCVWVDDSFTLADYGVDADIDDQTTGSGE